MHNLYAVTGASLDKAGTLQALKAHNWCGVLFYPWNPQKWDFYNVFEIQLQHGQKDKLDEEIVPLPHFSDV